MGVYTDDCMLNARIFMARNKDWFTVDEELTQLAIDMHDSYIKSNINDKDSLMQVEDNIRTILNNRPKGLIDRLLKWLEG
jgi:hypothetical protein